MPVPLGLLSGSGPLLPSIRTQTNQRSDSNAEIFTDDTTTYQPFSESDINYDLRNRFRADGNSRTAAGGRHPASEATKQINWRNGYPCAVAGSGYGRLFAPSPDETIRSNVDSLAEWL